MKILLFAVLFIFSYSTRVYSQKPTNDGAVPQFTLADNKIIYYAQIKTDSAVDKPTMFLKAENWYKKNLETADNTLIIDNSNDGIISGTGIVHAKKHDQKADPGDVFFTIDIHVARGMYTYTVHDIYSFDNTGKFYYSDMYNEEQYPTGKPKWPEPYRHGCLTAMNTKILGMITVLQNDMK